MTVTEAGSSDSRGERTDLYGPGDEGLLGADAGYLGPPLTPEKEEALQQATAVANLRAALMSKNSLLSLKADVLGDDSSLLLEYLPKGAHSLSRECWPRGRAALALSVRTAEGGRRRVPGRARFRPSAVGPGGACGPRGLSGRWCGTRGEGWGAVCAVPGVPY